MNGDQVRNVQLALQEFTGCDVSCADLGIAVGLAKDSANHKIRGWQRNGPTGPGGVALTYLAQGLNTWLPEHIAGMHNGDLYVIRLQWPRFVMRIALSGRPDHSHAIPAPEAKIIQWIDDVDALPSTADAAYYEARAIDFTKAPNRA
jgi:hypothetical protein